MNVCGSGIMWGFIVLAFGCITICSGQSSPSPTPPQVYCGEIPGSVYRCLGNPKIVNSVPDQCKKSISECERIKCTFTHEGWMDGNDVNRQKVTEHFEDYVKSHPEWTQAVQYVKDSCLAGPIPAQGVYINCPAYDVVHCSLIGFLRNAQPTQWSNAPECVAARQYIGACPVCPTDCFAPSIPNGSCNACRLLPTH